ncbi:flagellar biosynthesis protein FlhF [Campylobacter sp. RM9344]|uniref:Flagellar biosynthesis protein FlhF n=1 Tax=Campylobacter californiensis TaxID=1032243 RepID=A0AAW3ZTH2_9BACT|nr:MULTISPECIES: flagellar biosynthesis protein FlhF [unclassified Campylobacter]MBE2984375.1 flagellar biosynthesis protein FlhF [Campylobacter sp. RM6883]MBE2995810.1 flagellar biosynthesis protein FlhF [Campylobacter sp. RM6913]MBE3029641.1 flagellar biosynthesis protein FlhF [Campylobacter sp. RM9344]MBE3607126.1 flagellar biosynthesis protein FlhF [Campylobacter sp. RM9337]QCD50275.1 flagellar biosynthesis (GTP-binding) protein [Campylobacter sp. RM6914]
MATKFYTFTGESSIEALKKAQETCGERAILVTTKQIQAKTINKKPLYEILVSVEEEDVPQKPKPNPKAVNYENAYSKFNSSYEPIKPKFNITEEPAKEKPQIKTTPARPYDVDESVLLNISEAAKEISQIANVDMSKIKAVDEQAHGVNKKIDDVAKQVSVLNEKLGLITDMIWDERAPSRNNLAIPPEFASIYKAAKQSGMKQEHLEAIINATIENMPTSMKANPTAVKRYFYSLLRNMLPCRKEINDRKQRIMMLVGPTGVGKTTTLAKLAARFAYGSEKRYKTGIITLDTYRIGAVEQLFQYAKMMKLPILDVIEVEDFKNALKTLNYCDIILIDTTGNSQYDKEKLDKLDKFLKYSDVQIDVNLVLSAGSKVEDLIEIYNGFSFLDIDTLIITKFDETKIFGNVFSLIYETNTPVSYFCVGQEVPDDLLEAKSEFLVECVLEGYSKNSEDKDEK